MEPAPNRVITLMTPNPRISSKCSISFGGLPISSSLDISLISTLSSATKRCPRLTNSSAVSLFPIPESPVINTPTP